MTEQTYLSYLELLDDLREKLSALCELISQKSKAVLHDDLTALEQIMRQEQAMSLAFRGLEQKKNTLARELHLDTVPLSAVAEHYPEHLRLRARNTTGALQQQFQAYRSASESVRSTLEGNLHEIENILASQNAAPAAGPGYTAQPVEPPKSMKSDFRA